VPRAAVAVDPYEINVILPLTGTYAFVGKGSEAGLAGVEHVVNASGGVNGRPIKFVVTDDASSPQNSVQIANALMAKGVPVFFASSVQDCGAIIPLVKDGRCCIASRRACIRPRAATCSRRTWPPT